MFGAVTGSVKRIAPDGHEFAGGVGRGHATPSKTSRSVPVFPLVAGGDPAVLSCLDGAP